MTRAVVFGAGRIGCGVLGAVLREAGIEVTFVARDRALAEHLERVRRFRVVRAAPSGQDVVTVEGFRAIALEEHARVAAAVSTASHVFTAVGARGLRDVARRLAAPLAEREAPADVIACENVPHAGKVLAAQLKAAGLTDRARERHGVASAVVNRIVARRIGDPAQLEPLTFVGDAVGGVEVDGLALRRALPPASHLVAVPDYEARFARKLYVFGAGHATCAYLAHLKGYRYMHAAVRDPEIRVAVLAAMREGQRGVAARYGGAVAAEVDLEAILARFGNAALLDPVSRVARDPLRKLRPEDRLLGAAALAEAAGTTPHALGLAAAAALCFSDPESDGGLARALAADGVVTVLQRELGLDGTAGPGRIVTEEWKRLAGGRRAGGVLLSLDRLLWSLRSAATPAGPPREPRPSAA